MSMVKSESETKWKATVLGVSGTNILRDDSSCDIENHAKGCGHGLKVGDIVTFRKGSYTIRKGKLCISFTC